MYFSERGSNFRGGSAPASLKHRDRLVNQLLDVGEFPGWICPGLIEAPRMSVTSSTERTTDFRGGSAPASLKQGAP